MNACSGSDANIDRSGEVDKSGSLVLIRGSLKASTSPNYPICQQPERVHIADIKNADSLKTRYLMSSLKTRLDGTRFCGL